jgi:hypothetical protein
MLSFPYYSTLETFAFCNGFQVSGLFFIDFSIPSISVFIYFLLYLYYCKYIVLLDICVYVSNSTVFFTSMNYMLASPNT